MPTFPSFSITRPVGIVTAPTRSLNSPLPAAIRVSKAAESLYSSMAVEFIDSLDFDDSDLERPDDHARSPQLPKDSVWFHGTLWHYYDDLSVGEVS
jgi:hypothetical protein